MKRRRWAVKAGSQVVCSGGPELVKSWMAQVERLQTQHGIDVVWITSGAIASAEEKFSFPGKQKTLPEKQALSAIGQPLVMEQYNQALNKLGLKGAQVLLTADDMIKPSSRKNLLNTLNTLMDWKTIPILNENDAIATAEIKFGDNDQLSALIARLMKVDKLILLTDVSGFYDEDPKNNPNAKIIRHKKTISQKDLAQAAKYSSSQKGTGGIYSKLLAAKLAQKARVVTHIVSGHTSEVLIKIAQNEKVGTQIGGTL